MANACNVTLVIRTYVAMYMNNKTPLQTNVKVQGRLREGLDPIFNWHKLLTYVFDTLCSQLISKLVTMLISGSLTTLLIL